MCFIQGFTLRCLTWVATVPLLSSIAEKTRPNQRPALTHNKVYLVVSKCFLFSSSAIWLYSYLSQQSQTLYHDRLIYFCEFCPCRGNAGRVGPDLHLLLCIGVQMQVEIQPPSVVACVFWARFKREVWAWAEAVVAQTKPSTEKHWGGRNGLRRGLAGGSVVVWVFDNPSDTALGLMPNVCGIPWAGRRWCCCLTTCMNSL